MVLENQISPPNMKRNSGTDLSYDIIVVMTFHIFPVKDT